MRRHQCENIDADPIVWTNQRFIRWARNIDLNEYADNLKGRIIILIDFFPPVLSSATQSIYFFLIKMRTVYFYTQLILFYPPSKKIKKYCHKLAIGSLRSIGVLRACLLRVFAGL